jgi:hypothetical protein
MISRFLVDFPDFWKIGGECPAANGKPCQNSIFRQFQDTSGSGLIRNSAGIEL